MTSASSTQAVTPRHYADLRQRDWLLGNSPNVTYTFCYVHLSIVLVGIESAFDTIQFLAYDPHKDFLLFGYDYGSDPQLGTLTYLHLPFVCPLLDFLSATSYFHFMLPFKVLYIPIDMLSSEPLLTLIYLSAMAE